MSSQLRVLLLGRDRWTTETGNALLGREDFSLSESPVQRETVRLPDGRSLQVIPERYGEDPALSKFVFLWSEEHTSHTATASDAVILVMEINSDLRLSYFLPKGVWTENTPWRNVVKRKGVIVVTRGDRFREAQNKGEITVSFIDWMRNCGGIPGILFQATQERCLLFDNAGSEDVLNTQRDELIHMIDSRVLGEGFYTDMKFKEAELFSRELNKDLQELKQKVHKDIGSLEEKSQKTETCLKHMNNQLEGLQENLKEKTGVLQTTLGNFDRDSKETEERFQTLETQLIKFEKNCATDSQEAAQRFQTLETQLIKLEKNCATDSQEAAQRFQTLETQLIKLEKIRKPLLILILLVLLLLPLLSSLWPVTSNSLKEITALDVSSDLRRYMDLKLEQAVKIIQENEKHLFGLNETYPNNVSKIRQEMTEQFTQLKERLVHETADLTEDIKKNITSRILVWDMIESLPLSLPLIMVLTLLVLLLTPVPLPVPWAWLLAALLAALLILQFLLLLVLLGV
ncbi:hypothetical protein RRG08_019717 [Elysia crispata]|uniref:Uncharacterized protein n=1 Tax=Elysia crispata TaxID=231223 RepID=A0AAE1A948_9GAST|nr:hypothetical protein RRG08_019717 [Elysia crispata]